MKPKKPVNIKSVKTTPAAPSWRKCSVFFRTPKQCRWYAMGLCIKLRTYAPAVYFARYTNASQCRADYYFMLPPGEKSAMKAWEMLSHLDDVNFRITEVTPCEGSMAHAMGTDVAIILFTQHIANGASDAADAHNPERMQTAWTQLADVMHWTTNMLGIDYCDEAKLHLYSIDRIINVFHNSIKLGKKLNRRLPKTKSERN